MLKVQCEACGKQLGVPEKYAGRTGKCPACERPVQVPMVPPAETLRDTQPHDARALTHGRGASAPAAVAAAAVTEEPLPTFEAADPAAAKRATWNLRSQSQLMFGTFAALVLWEVLDALFKLGGMIPSDPGGRKHMGTAATIVDSLGTGTGFDLFFLIMVVQTCIYLPLRWRRFRTQPQPYRWMALVGGIGLVALVTVNLAVAWAAWIFG